MKLKKTNINELILNLEKRKQKGFPTAMIMQKTKFDINQKPNSYPRFLKSLGCVDNPSTKKQYKKEIKSIKNVHVLPTEQNYIMGRKIWSDVVSITHQMNGKEDILIKYRTMGLEKLKNLGIKNVENVYSNCINYLRDFTVLTLSFRDRSSELTSYLLTNIWQLKDSTNSLGRTNSGRYASDRKETEDKYFAYLPTKIKNDLLSNDNARPCYGTLRLLDQNEIIRSTSVYGKSFIVFKDVVKLNALFLPGDSMNLHSVHQPATVSYLEILFAQCPKHTFSAIVDRVSKGHFPISYDQNHCYKSGGYLEVMLPHINWLDPNLVEHIHLHPSEILSFTQKELATIARFGISISYSYENPYVALAGKLFDAIENHDAKLVNKMLKKHPSLIKLTDEQGKTVLKRMLDSNNLLFLSHALKKLDGSLYLNLKNQLISIKRDYIMPLIEGDATDKLSISFINNLPKQIKKILQTNKQKNNPKLLIYAAQVKAWPSVFAYLECRQVAFNDLIALVKIAEEQGGKREIKQIFATYIPLLKLESYIVNSIMRLSPLKVCNKLDHDFLYLLICEFISASNNPHSCVKFLNAIFAIENQFPFLTIPETAISCIGARWEGRAVSTQWRNVIEAAKKQIVNLTKAHPKCIGLDDSDIVKFLATRTSIYTSYFAEPQALSDYFSVRNTRQHSLLPKLKRISK